MIKARQKIMIVEQDPIYALGLEALIAGNGNYNVCDMPRTPSQTLGRIDHYDPDLIITELFFGERLTGVRLISDIRKKYQKMPILAVSKGDEIIFGRHALRAGANGYVMKGCDQVAISSAVEKVMTGDQYITGRLSNLLFDLKIKGVSPSNDPYCSLLSEREFEVFCLYGYGMRIKEIARKLDLSPKTISTYVTRAQEKLNISTARKLVPEAVLYVHARKMLRDSPVQNAKLIRMG